MAMGLAAIGLFGALSYSVAQRRRELAIRAALGARCADIVRLVLREGLLVTLPGIVLGLGGAAAFARLVQQLLFGVTPHDPITYVVAPLALTAVSLAACLPPAFRAAAADPATRLQARERTADRPGEARAPEGCCQQAGEKTARLPAAAQ
jgi:putative ABC transport system permease protein